MYKLNLLFLALASFLSCSHTPAKAEMSRQTARFFTSPDADAAYLYLETEVDDVSAGKVINGIKKANKEGRKTIVLTIDSPGGVVGNGLEIIDAIEESDAAVVCYVHRMAASMAAALLQSCDERIMSKRSFLMLHEPSTGFGGGKADNIQQEVDFMRVLSLMLTEQYALKSKMTADEVAVKIKNYDWFLSWKEAVELGFVDRAI